MAYDQSVTKSIDIDAPPSKIWQALTTPEIIAKWLSDSDIRVVSDWTVGSPIIRVGRLHGIKFRDKGAILRFEPEQWLEYSSWSAINRIPDIPENYSITSFQLASQPTHTTLTVSQRNLATEVMYKHVDFYWNVTVHKIKRLIEAS